MHTPNYYKHQITRLQSLIQESRGPIRSEYAEAIRLAKKQLRRATHV